MTRSHITTRMIATTVSLLLGLVANSQVYARPASPVLECRTVKEIRCDTSPSGQLSNCRDVIKTVCETVAGPGSGRID